MGQGQSAAALPAASCASGPPAEPELEPVVLCASSKLLSAEQAQRLAKYLPATTTVASREEWRPLFNSSDDGLSFRTFCNRVQGKGPSVLVVRDTGGSTFGAFVPLPWNPSSSFSGTFHAFLFTCDKQAQGASGGGGASSGSASGGGSASSGSASGGGGGGSGKSVDVFHSTGRNEHWLYFNHGMSELWNGVGIGGQMGFFGLSLNELFDGGTSMGPCSTFDSPCLSSSPEFKLDSVEVWDVSELPKPDSDDEDDEYGYDRSAGAEDGDAARAGGPAGQQQSVLDRTKDGERVLLDSLGRGRASDGIREAPPLNTEEEDVPGMPKSKRASAIPSVY